MHYWPRVIGYLVRSLPVFVRARVGRDGRRSSRIERRVKFSEIDLNGHMNQAVYAQVFELGRMDYLLRSGAWPYVRGRGINAVVAEQRIVYRRELKPGQSYFIDTRATHVEGRLLVCESYLVVGDRVHAHSEAKLIFIGEDGVLSPERTAELCDDFLTEPLGVQDWRLEKTAD